MFFKYIFQFFSVVVFFSTVFFSGLSYGFSFQRFLVQGSPHNPIFCMRGFFLEEGGFLLYLASFFFQRFLFERRKCFFRRGLVLYYVYGVLFLVIQEFLFQSGFFFFRRGCMFLFFLCFPIFFFDFFSTFSFFKGFFFSASLFFQGFFSQGFLFFFLKGLFAWDFLFKEFCKEVCFFKVFYSEFSQKKSFFKVFLTEFVFS